MYTSRLIKWGNPMEALFFSFAKRKNSLKVPVDSTGTSFNVVIKEPTSYDAPTLIITADTFPYNYAKFEGQYFFIAQTISRRNNLWEVHLDKDVLATYRAQILATSAYILYDNVGNSEIVDNRLAINTSRTVDSNSAPFPDLDATGCYAVTIVGEGSTDLYLLDDLYSLVSSTFLDNVIADMDETSSITPATETGSLLLDIGNQLYKNGSRLVQSTTALEAIKSCVWIPLPKSVFWGNTRTIKLGKFSTGVSGKYLGGGGVYAQLTQTSVNIPWQASDWRRNAPYTQVYLYIPFVGVVSLPASQLTGAAAITIQGSVSPATGDISINVNNDQQVLGSYGGNCGAAYPVGASNQAQKGLVNTIVGVAATGVSAALGLGVGAAALSGVAMAASSQIAGMPTSIGGISSAAAMGLSRNIICFTSFHDTAVAPASVADVIGLPSFSKKTISTLSGYCQCHEFSLNAAAKSGDLDAVNNFMNSGVFIE